LDFARGRFKLEGMRRLLVPVALALAAGVLVQPAGAKRALGILGDANRFQALTGQQSQVGHVIVG
jgi:hypothetical protein